MRLAAFALVFLSLVAPAFAQMTPGLVIANLDNPCPVRVQDVNGDGLDDLILTTQIMINNGTSFTPRALNLAGHDSVIGVLDVNGDGRPDLLTDNQYGPLGPHQIRLYIADAAGNYPAVGQTIGENIAPPLFADVDGDGKDDLLMQKLIRDPGNRFRVLETEISVWRSRGDGTFDVLPSFRIPGEADLRNLRANSGDINRDGLPDLLLRTANNEFVFLYGAGGGKFTVQTRYAPPAVWGSWDLHLADIDGDGNLDIVFPAVRAVRVLFGDGHGNFPRMAAGDFTKKHEMVGAPSYIANYPEGMAQPRELILGHFTRVDRTEIAGGTAEGDIVVLAYDHGALSEVSRTPTEYWYLDVSAGNFRGLGRTDILGFGMQSVGFPPSPRLFYGTNDTAPPATQRPGRNRSAAQPAPARTVLNVRIQDGCSHDIQQRLVLQRDGVYGRTDNAEAVFDGSKIYLRLNMPEIDSDYPLDTTLLPWDGAYVSELIVHGPCAYSGLTTAYFSATVESR